MKKWIITLVISTVCFSLFTYMSGFCEFVSLPIVGGLTRKARFFLFYSPELFGSRQPAFIFPLMALMSLLMLIVSTTKLHKIFTFTRKWLIYSTILFPLLLITYFSQDKVFMYPVNISASDVEYYTAVVIDQDTNTIRLYNSAYGVAKPVHLKANASKIQIVDNGFQNQKSMILFYRKNQLASTQYIDLITVNGEIQYRARPFVLPDLRNGLIIVINGRIDVRWPWSTPIPAPTNAPS